MSDIITSPLDLDFYKITMQAAVFKFYNDVKVKYKFTCRTPNINFTNSFEDIKSQIMSLEKIRFTDKHIEYLNTIPFIPKAYLRYLPGFKFNPKEEISIKLLNDGKLDLEISGYWLTCILYETMILSIVNECYFENTYGNIKEKLLIEGYSRLMRKVNFIKAMEKEISNFKYNFKFADFMTRRRFSKYQQHTVISTLIKENIKEFIGSSNVMFAQEFNIIPIGTMAHEWIMAHAGFTRFDHSQKLALQKWLELYENNLGICLTDTYGTDKFIKDYDVNLARAFNGNRHDSNDPIKWTKKIAKMYQDLKIDTKTKQVVYSDSLTIESAVEIFKEVQHLFQTSYGIGTSLGNDMGVDSINIVIKMTECNGFPCIKLSDCEGKIMCDNKDFENFAVNFIKRNN